MFLLTEPLVAAQFTKLMYLLRVRYANRRDGVIIEADDATTATQVENADDAAGAATLIDDDSGSSDDDDDTGDGFIAPDAAARRRRRQAEEQRRQGSNAEAQSRFIFRGFGPSSRLRRRGTSLPPLRTVRRRRAMSVWDAMQSASSSQGRGNAAGEQEGGLIAGVISAGVDDDDDLALLSQLEHDYLPGSEAFIPPTAAAEGGFEPNGGTPMRSAAARNTKTDEKLAWQPLCLPLWRADVFFAGAFAIKSLCRSLMTVDGRQLLMAAVRHRHRSPAGGGGRVDTPPARRFDRRPGEDRGVDDVDVFVGPQDDDEPMGGLQKYRKLLEHIDRLLQPSALSFFSDESQNGGGGGPSRHPSAPRLGSWLLRAVTSGTPLPEVATALTEALDIVTGAVGGGRAEDGINNHHPTSSSSFLHNSTTNGLAYQAAMQLLGGSGVLLQPGGNDGGLGSAHRRAFDDAPRLLRPGLHFTSLDGDAFVPRVDVDRVVKMLIAVATQRPAHTTASATSPPPVRESTSGEGGATGGVPVSLTAAVLRRAMAPIATTNAVFLQHFRIASFVEAWCELVNVLALYDVAAEVVVILGGSSSRGGTAAAQRTHYQGTTAASAEVVARCHVTTLYFDLAESILDALDVIKSSAVFSVALITSILAPQLSGALQSLVTAIDAGLVAVFSATTAGGSSDAAAEAVASAGYFDTFTARVSRLTERLLAVLLHSTIVTAAPPTGSVRRAFYAATLTLLATVSRCQQLQRDHDGGSKSSNRTVPLSPAQSPSILRVDDAVLARFGADLLANVASTVASVDGVLSSPRAVNSPVAPQFGGHIGDASAVVGGRMIATANVCLRTLHAVLGHSASVMATVTRGSSSSSRGTTGRGNKSWRIAAAESESSALFSRPNGEEEHSSSVHFGGLGGDHTAGGLLDRSSSTLTPIASHRPLLHSAATEGTSEESFAHLAATAAPHHRWSGAAPSSMPSAAVAQLVESCLRVCAWIVGRCAANAATTATSVSTATTATMRMFSSDVNTDEGGRRPQPTFGDPHRRRLRRHTASSIRFVESFFEMLSSMVLSSPQSAKTLHAAGLLDHVHSALFATTGTVEQWTKSLYLASLERQQSVQRQLAAMMMRLRVTPPPPPFSDHPGSIAATIVAADSVAATASCSSWAATGLLFRQPLAATEAALHAVLTLLTDVIVSTKGQQRPLIDGVLRLFFVSSFDSTPPAMGSGGDGDNRSIAMSLSAPSAAAVEARLGPITLLLQVAMSVVWETYRAVAAREGGAERRGSDIAAFLLGKHPSVATRQQPPNRGAGPTLSPHQDVFELFHTTTLPTWSLLCNVARDTATAMTTTTTFADLLDSATSLMALASGHRADVLWSLPADSGSRSGVSASTMEGSNGDPWARPTGLLLPTLWPALLLSAVWDVHQWATAVAIAWVVAPSDAATAAGAAPHHPPMTTQEEHRHQPPLPPAPQAAPRWRNVGTESAAPVGLLLHHEEKNAAVMARIMDSLISDATVTTYAQLGRIIVRLCWMLHATLVNSRDPAGGVLLGGECNSVAGLSGSNNSTGHGTSSSVARFLANSAGIRKAASRSQTMLVEASEMLSRHSALAVRHNAATQQARRPERGGAAPTPIPVNTTAPAGCSWWGRKGPGGPQTSAQSLDGLAAVLRQAAYGLQLFERVVTSA